MKKFDFFLNFSIKIMALVCVGLIFVFVINLSSVVTRGKSVGSLLYDTMEKGGWTDPALASVSVVNFNSNGYIVKKQAPSLKISALSFLVADVESGDVIVAKNSNTVRPIASISKLITILTAQDLPEQSSPVPISLAAVGTYGKAGNLRAGEKISVEELFYPLLLESSNDAAEALAEYYGRDFFLQQMNGKAKSLGLYHTNFEDPSGLSSNNVSTVTDLFKLARYIFIRKPEVFSLTCRQHYYGHNHLWRNANSLSRLPNYLGGKNGFTDEAQKTIVALYEVPVTGAVVPKKIAIILLGSKNLTSDVRSIINYLKQNVVYAEAGA